MIEREGHRLEKVSERWYRCASCLYRFSAVFLLEAPKVPSCYGIHNEYGDGRPIRYRYEMPPEGWEGWRDGNDCHLEWKPIARHMSYEAHRLVGDDDFTRRWERAFAWAWMRQNHPAMNHAISGGHGILADLIGFDMGAEPFMGHRHFHPVRWPITRRETRAAATVVQWMGTNCGRGFLHEVLRLVGHRIVSIEKETTE
jgi:hypothetical protein